MGLLLSFFLFVFILIGVMVISLVVRLGLGIFLLRRNLKGGKKNASANHVKQTTTQQKQKIIPKDEGEYVDFEEV